MLQQDQPEDFVIGSGETHSVQEFLDLAFDKAELDPTEHVATDEKYFRPTEVDLLLADPTKAKQKLGWEPKITFEQLVETMVEHDISLAAREVRSLGI